MGVREDYGVKIHATFVCDGGSRDSPRVGKTTQVTGPLPMFFKGAAGQANPALFWSALFPILFITKKKENKSQSRESEGGLPCLLLL